ncbi:HlyD family efflux transporter periplasmic adaptor subunit [uncultured Roseovarius sp.]|uniref:efflux RND transporter periplasmic adaptor subunit n=1 Tax=uncultured Roseovarius sp. TaxID=293344 RepID=UPI002619AC1A|nr:HlyD family efflux transporter periplasmic adaptor subunit [uncultured Roseovarius sp.]
MRFLRHSLTGLFLLSLTLGLLSYAGYSIFSAVQERMASEPEALERRERVFAVNVVTAVEQEVTPVLRAFGEVESRRTLEVRAKASGTLVELAEDFVEGGQVAAGQLLARVDPADAQSALDRAASDLLDARDESREADRALKLAQEELAAAEDQSELRARAYRRQLDLEERGVGTAAAVETAELAAAQARQAVLGSWQSLAQAEARVDQAATRMARAEIAQAEAQRRLNDTRITAGFAGTLSDVSVVQGGLVAANEQLAKLVDGNKLEVAFRVSTPQYLRLLNEEGLLIRAPVTVTLDVFGIDLQVKGVISRDSAIVGEGQTGRLIFARLTGATGMKPGDFVTVTIEEPPLDRIVRLPASALGPDGRVLALLGEDRLEALEVRLMRRQGDDILVRGEMLEGREIVSQRSPLLGAGIKVRPLRNEADDAASASEMLELSEDRRARLVAFVEGSTDMPEAVKIRLLGQLAEPRVPARMVKRLEGRMGG